VTVTTRDKTGKRHLATLVLVGERFGAQR